MTNEDITTNVDNAYSRGNIMQPNESPKTDYVGLVDEARRIGVSDEWLRKCVRLGKLQAVRAGKKILVRRGAVDAMLDATATAVAK
jgi:excisionase family DNA binding protein